MKLNIDEAAKNNITVGYGSYMGTAKIHLYDDKTKLNIGKYTCIASDVHIILGGNHRKDFVTQFPFNDDELRNTYPNIPVSKVPYDSSCGDINIGSDVWIGYGCIILSGSTIGHGSVIGAGTVVRPTIEDGEIKQKSIPPYSIVIGNPAKVIGMRFPVKIASRLLEMKWWDWELNKIQEAMPLLQQGNVEKFIHVYGG